VGEGSSDGEEELAEYEENDFSLQLSDVYD
jgi:hypothetical protein